MKSLSWREHEQIVALVEQILIHKFIAFFGHFVWLPGNIGVQWSGWILGYGLPSPVRRISEQQMNRATAPGSKVGHGCIHADHGLALTNPRTALHSGLADVSQLCLGQGLISFKLTTLHSGWC